MNGEPSSWSRTYLILHPDENVHDEYRRRGDCEVVFEPQRFNELAGSLRAEYSQYIDMLSRSHGLEADWWVTPVAERNTYVSDAFLNVSYLTYASDVLRRRQVSHIISHSRGLARSLQYLPAVRDRRIAVRVRRSGLRKRLKAITAVRVLRTVVAFSWLSLKRLCIARWTGRARRMEWLGAPFWLADTYVFDNSFESGRFANRYYGDLIETTRDRNWVYLPTLYGIKNYWRAYRAMRRNDVPFLIKEDYLSLKDHCWSLLHPLRLLRMERRYASFRGHRVDPIFEEEMRYGCCSISSLEGLLNYRLAARLAERGIRVSLLLDWFENQCVDKGQNLGFRCYHPDIVIVGYQGFLQSSNFLCSRVTEQELAARVSPHVVAVMGKSAVLRAKELCAGLQVVCAPAFRFRRLRLAPGSAVKRRRLVVALPVTVRQSLEVLRMFRMATRLLPRGTAVTLKAHATMRGGAVGRLIRALVTSSPNVEDASARDTLRDASSGDALGDAALVVSSASGVLVEALARGIPVIVVGSRTELTHNPIPREIDGWMWALAYSAEELAAQAERVLAVDEAARQRMSRMGRDVLRDYFEPTDEESLRSFAAWLGSLVHEPHGWVRDNCPG